MSGGRELSEGGAGDSGGGADGAGCASAVDDPAVRVAAVKKKASERGERLPRQSIVGPALYHFCARG
jgi:hypothetical protein